MDAPVALLTLSCTINPTKIETCAYMDGLLKEADQSIRILQAIAQTWSKRAVADPDDISRHAIQDRITDLEAVIKQRPSLQNALFNNGYMRVGPSLSFIIAAIKLLQISVDTFAPVATDYAAARKELSAKDKERIDQSVSKMVNYTRLMSNPSQDTAIKFEVEMDNSVQLSATWFMPFREDGVKMGNVTLHATGNRLNAFCPMKLVTGNIAKCGHKITGIARSAIDYVCHRVMGRYFGNTQIRLIHNLYSAELDNLDPSDAMVPIPVQMAAVEDAIKVTRESLVSVRRVAVLGVPEGASTCSEFLQSVQELTGQAQISFKDIFRDDVSINHLVLVLNLFKARISFLVEEHQKHQKGPLLKFTGDQPTQLERTVKLMETYLEQLEHPSASVEALVKMERNIKVNVYREGIFPIAVPGMPFPCSGNIVAYSAIMRLLANIQLEHFLKNAGQGKVAFAFPHH